MTASPPTMPLKDHKRITFLLVALVFFMLGLAFLSVPLYQIFCKETGFGGTPKIATLAQLPGYSLKRQVKVHFTASTHRDLEWDFKTMQSETMINLGQVRIMFYKAKNISDRPIIGMATYNVTPEKAGSYFNKVACFCFEQQLLQPGEEMDMPVQFFIDPDYDKDSLMEDVNEITLSYTFFEYKP